ncbi:hypothetical protein ACROYT_G007641 [Oculina patagonica]
MMTVIVKTTLVLFLVTAYIQGADAGKTKNCRCRRLSNNTTIGIDITYWNVVDDVGRCEEICHNNNVFTKGNTKGYSCNPTEMLSKSYQLIGDTKYKSVIRKCGYQHTSGPCRRLSLYKTFFNGTTYSRRHDIGSCVGVCGIDGHECKAIDSRKIAIRGPNGDSDMTVSVTERCGCVSPGCHRVAFREVFKRKSEKGWIQEEKDVGMCVGTGCPRVCEHCLLEFMDLKSCGSYCTYFHPSVCIVTNYTTEAVYTGDFKTKEIYIINQCGCTKPR